MNPRSSDSQALKRFKVLDLTRIRSGPTCVRTLADFGAEVIRIDGASYRAKEADERDALRKAQRAAKSPGTRTRKAVR